VKTAARLLLPFALVLTACGLKVPTTIVQGSDTEIGQTATDFTGGTTAASAGEAADPGAGQSATDDTTTTDDPSTGIASTGLFASETEGVTKNSITLCTHVPITGAAPIPHHNDRFGQFYFNYVNAELGGVYGRKVYLRAYDDGYYPAGARQAVEKCSRQGSFIYIGAAGTDQIVSVAKWAERKRVPYLHGPTSDKDMAGFRYNIFAGPTYEYQSRLLADYLVKRYGKNVDYGMLRVNSPYFDAAHDAFIEQLRTHGLTLAADRVVQKDESQFQDVLFDFQNKGSKGARGIEVINNFTTPNIWIKILKQAAAYKPVWTAVSPVAGFNIVAVALKDGGQRAVVFHHFNPSCNCTNFTTDLDESMPWVADEKEFLRIFRKYSPEQTPPPDDFDYGSYLAARGFHRLLLALGPAPTRTGLFTLLKTYKEDPRKTFPGCAGDYSRIEGSRRSRGTSCGGPPCRSSGG
jgi:branched-chain amino acid transport system substrate-binding protein